VRDATTADLPLVGEISAAGFYDDPLMSWAVPDPSSRLELLRVAFTGLASTFLADTSELHIVDDACVTMWRAPAWAEPAPADDAEPAPSPFPPDVQERFRILGELMQVAHPHDEPHWYLNVIATLPSRQGRGLGATALGPMCARFDERGDAAYLESSNPRNMTLYRRHGFEEINDPIQLPDGPALYPMWRAPRTSSTSAW
jgi:ribosomal protein S18 acetylase RimI-like enzyme